MSKSRLVLIDAHALCYRSFFAVRELRTSQGQPTNAVFGFVNTLRKILRDCHPDYVVACFDVGKKTHRQERFAQYKIHRPSMPDDLISQIPLIKELVLAYNIPVFELEGFEADDVIATIAHRVSGKDIEVLIVSGDKDMAQLVNKTVKIYDYRSDEILDEKKIFEKYGFHARQMVDFLALAGDATDNIPGVHGIGKVTATDLIVEHGSVEDIYAHLSVVRSEKTRQKLEEQKEMAMLSRDLALLDSQVPIDFDLKSVRFIPADEARLVPFFEKLEFRKFAQELSGSQTQITCSESALTTHKDIDAFIKEALNVKRFGLAIDAQAQEDVADDVRIGLVLKDDMTFHLPLNKLGQMQKVFDAEDVLMICDDLKACLKVFDDQGILSRNKVFDVMLAGYLLEPAQANKDVATLCWKYLKTTIPQQDGFALAASQLLRLHKVLADELKAKALESLFTEVEMPLARVLFGMEKQGVGLDIAFLKDLSLRTNQQIQAIAKKLYQLAGQEFNLNSPKQLAHILFEKLKLPVVKKTKTGYSTDEDVLKRLAPKHELPQEILNYRQLTKLTTTYIDALPKMVDAKTHRIHAVFDQAGTETGRLSSRNPNLQNIPIRTELGRQIRKAFIAGGKDRVLVSADYSQIELRILAHLSQDMNLIEAFARGADIHTMTAATIFNVSEKSVTQDMRVVAKRINFGIVYGMSAFGLSKDLNVTQKEAQEFIDKYFLQYPGVPRFMQEQIHKAEKDGFVTTLLNRRRYIPEIHSDNMALRQFAQRQAFNTPVQGTAADLIKVGMIHVQKKLDEGQFRSKMTITVHDELVFDVLKKEQDDLVDLVRQQMEGPLSLSVPIRVSIKVGNNWLEMQEVSR